MARSSTKSYEIDMLNGAIFPKLLRFAVPLTLSTMLQLLFNAADVVVVGRYAGDNSLAASGLQHGSDQSFDKSVPRPFHWRQHSGRKALRCPRGRGAEQNPSTPPFCCPFTAACC